MLLYCIYGFVLYCLHCLYLWNDSRWELTTYIIGCMLEYIILRHYSSGTYKEFMLDYLKVIEVLILVYALTCILPITFFEPTIV